jgi:hypothetical protein
MCREAPHTVIEVSQSFLLAVFAFFLFVHAHNR